MLKDSKNKKQLIDFLIKRWTAILSFAAQERVYSASCKYAEDNNEPIPEPPLFFLPHACRQIEVIKQRIISILPEVKFIDYTYEAQAPLDPKDFVEIFVADHEQCISKIQHVIEQKKIQ